MTHNMNLSKSRSYLDYEFSLKSGKDIPVRKIFIASLNKFEEYTEREQKALEQIIDNLLRNYEREIFLVYDKYKELQTNKKNNKESTIMFKKYEDMIKRICNM